MCARAAAGPATPWCATLPLGVQPLGVGVGGGRHECGPDMHMTHTLCTGVELCAERSERSGERHERQRNQPAVAVQMRVQRVVHPAELALRSAGDEGQEEARKARAWERRLRSLV